MQNRRDFLKKATLLSAGAGLMHSMPDAIAKAFSIDPVAGSTYLDAEHIVFLMQENRSFDHAYGTLQGVRGFNDPRAITLPNQNPVWLQTNKDGETYAPFRLNMKDTKSTWMSSLPHSWHDQVDARNNGKYDKWLDAKRSGHKEYAAMPLTMGYYNREDIPFYYALADAFTVCDQNFCSSLTGTTPNRLLFWSGTIRGKADPDVTARVWNGDADYGNWVNWKTFPERLEENGISWKVYQNEISVGVGFEGEEDGWLGNFTDNPLEFFSQYQVKLSAAFIANIPSAIKKLNEEIAKSEKELASLGENHEKAPAIKQRLEWMRSALAMAVEDQKNYTIEKYNQLSPYEKNLHDKAFSTNKRDPFYHQLTSLKYHEGQIEREVQVPKGDVLHQFRDDVQQGQLPTVSWIVAPENYSDHPGAAWYGAWYISEVMDILTKNPEVWKKTIFILAYDENDGYFDHVPPFTVPHKPGTGLVSKNIDTALEYVTASQQSSGPEYMRESPIGLGYRVPLVIASPWSRGGWVCSEVFDHTSSLMFLEKFLSHKYGREIKETNITEWRRTICGDLSSVFRPWNGEKIAFPQPVKKEEFIETIHKAQFKQLPSGYRKLNAAEIAKAKKGAALPSILPSQEKGARSSNALAYELYADGIISADKKQFEIIFKAGNDIFGDAALGSPFNVYAPDMFRLEPVRAWSYAVAAGDVLSDKWLISDFDKGEYHLRVYGPNGFYREFTGSANDPLLDIRCQYEHARNNKQLTGNISLQLLSQKTVPQQIQIIDNAYKSPLQTKAVSGKSTIVLDLAKNSGWYDFSVRIKGNALFEKRFAGRVETGRHSKTDPFMGRAV